MSTDATTAAPLLLTVPEVARRLRLHRDSVYRKIAAGEIPAVRLGPRGAMRIDQAELDLYLYGEPGLLRDEGER